MCRNPTPLWKRFQNRQSGSNLSPPGDFSYLYDIAYAMYNGLRTAMRSQNGSETVNLLGTVGVVFGIAHHQSLLWDLRVLERTEWIPTQDKLEQTRSLITALSPYKHEIVKRYPHMEGVFIDLE